jgi:ribosomal protein S18 acetylase RimI-like enzyme
MEEKIIKLDIKNQDFLDKCVKLYCEIWKEPPWNEIWNIKKVKKNARKEMQRLNANGFLAINSSIKVIGFTWGYEVLREDLQKISGANNLDFIFKNGERIFYIDELGVHSSFRRRGIGERLSCYLISAARNYGKIRCFILRTDTKAIAAKGLYNKLGFNDLYVKDSEHYQRTYWLLEIP